MIFPDLCVLCTLQLVETEGNTSLFLKNFPSKTTLSLACTGIMDELSKTLAFASFPSQSTKQIGWKDSYVLQWDTFSPLYISFLQFSIPLQIISVSVAC